MSARLLTPTWRVIVRIEMGGGWCGHLPEARASLGMPSKRVAGSGALRITGRRVGDVRLLKTSSRLLYTGLAGSYASN